MVWKSGALTSFLLASLAYGGQVCNLTFSDCPGKLTSGTLTVPKEVIWLDPKIPVCTEMVQVQTGTGGQAPTSIVFIIDNSGSMNDNTNPTDPTNARYEVVSNLLDSIKAQAPGTDVGMVMFSRRLAFDHRENPFFKTAFPGDTSQHDSFVPLTPLNFAFPNGRTGLDTLQTLLKHKANGDLLYATQLPATRANATYTNAYDVRAGTDITLGFDAAKIAMADSKAAKANQYFIFLSDGAPSKPDDIRAARMLDFVKGTGVPTTFTVFFQPGSNPNPPAPQVIIDMTANIKINGYSSSNSKSAYWAINLPGNQLHDLLQNNVLNPIFTNVPAQPKSAVLDVGTTPINNISVDTKYFTFPKPVALNADVTTINLSYTYTYTDSAGKPAEKTVPYTLTVKRSATSALSNGLGEACRDQGDLSLLANGAPISIVTADHNQLDIHLSLTAGEACNGCSVRVTPSKSADKESIVMTPASGFQTGTFGRQTTASPVPGDGILQNVPGDSIILVYINPDNPLDSIRKSFPYSDIQTTLDVIRHNDVAKPEVKAALPDGDHFVVVAPASLNATPESNTKKNWNLLPGPLSAADSARYVGVGIEASRAFKVEVDVYSNLGEFVNKLALSMTQDEYQKLPKGSKNNTRAMRVLWDCLAQNGSPAGTGAYILKTTVTLLKIPSVAEDQAVRSEYRIVGVLRSRK